MKPAEDSDQSEVRSMFGLFEEHANCPSCGGTIAPEKVKVTKFHEMKVFCCNSCKSSFVKSRRAELFRVLEEGVILC